MKKEEIIKRYLDVLEIDFEIKGLEDITKLIKAHLRTFPFSSLKVLLKEDILLDLDSIYENIILKKRGGYCFEHNKLIYEVLKEFGFNVTHYLARVVNNTDNMPPQTHRFTVLEFEKERYLIDVGIGFRSPSVLVKFCDDVSISHLDIEYKILELEDNTFAMRLIEKEKPFIATKFDLNKCYETDFDMGNFYSHKNPNAVFVNNLVISLIKDEVIHSLVNENYFKIYKNKTEKIEIKTVKELEEILLNDFNSNFSFEEVEFFFSEYVNKKI